jgi:hypothetical protein
LDEQTGIWIDKTKITLEDQQEKIQTAKKSTKAEIIFAAAKEPRSLPIFSCKLDRWVLIHASCEN